MSDLQLGAYAEGRDVGRQEMNGELMPGYSAALDEIWQLRCALAYEAGVTEAHLVMKSFPKSRRSIAEGSVERMRRAARGDTFPAYRDIARWAKDAALRDAGAPDFLNRTSWEDGLK